MSEELTQWVLSIAKTLAMGAAVWLVWLLRNAFIAGWDVHKFVNRLDDQQREITELKRRLDVAGKATSDLATHVQGMPERMRNEFVPRRELDLQFSTIRVEGQRLWDEIQSLWRVVNRREDGKRGQP